MLHVCLHFAAFAFLGLSAVSRALDADSVVGCVAISQCYGICKTGQLVERLPWALPMLLLGASFANS